MAPDGAGRGRGALGRSGLRVLSLVVFLLVGEAIALVAGRATMPSPLEVGRFIVAETAAGELLRHLAYTLARVAAAFVIAMAIGTAIGIAMGRSQLIDLFGDSWLIVLLNTPALVITVLAYVWFGLNEAAAIGAVALNKIPNVAVTMREGTRALDPKLDEVAEVYRMSALDRLRHVVLPQLGSYLAASARSGLALIWKVVLLVELLGRSNGVGYAIHLHFQNFDVTAILGYSVAFAAVMLVIEYALVQPVERHASRWRIRHA
ncbi:ABC transporter permease [Prosthecodimorpha staleyi]|nr:ABC transporter permease subunit [Prosthecodimorpha staleyi]